MLNFPRLAAKLMVNIVVKIPGPWILWEKRDHVSKKTGVHIGILLLNYMWMVSIFISPYKGSPFLTVKPRISWKPLMGRSPSC